MVFWSPGSDFIGFTTRQAVKRVPLAGGPVTVLCQLPREFPQGATWSPDGDSIIFATGGVFSLLYEVPARGGPPKPLFEPEKATERDAFANPHFLPLAKGPRMLLFRLNSVEPQIVLRNLDTGQEQVLSEGTRPFYSPSGHIVYDTLDGGPLWALPFSIDSLKSTGEAFPIARNARFASIAANGTMAYVDPAEGDQQRLVWWNRQGAKIGEIGQPQEDMLHLDLSPDGRRIAITAIQRGDSVDIWLHDTARPTKTLLTSNPAGEGRPLWSPSGDQVIFFRNNTIFGKFVDSSGEATRLLTTPLRSFPTDWSPDGKSILYLRPGEANSIRELWYLRRKEDDSGYEPVPFLQTRFNVEEGQFSHDGRFVAYLSDESGSKELYVTPFPESGAKWSISTNGARQPLWSPAGNELYYLEGPTLVAVEVKTTPEFSVGRATRLFSSDNFAPADSHTYDVSADGQRFVIREAVEGREPPTIRVVQNWFAEFSDQE